MNSRNELQVAAKAYVQEDSAVFNARPYCGEFVVHISAGYKFKELILFRGAPAACCQVVGLS
eukprot:8944679-Lingulodinium_polyedra.AAC.1